MNDTLQMMDPEIPVAQASSSPGRQPVRTPIRPENPGRYRYHSPEKSPTRSPIRATSEHLRTLGHNLDDKKAYEFSKVIEYTKWDHKRPDNTPEEFFDNLIHKIETYLKRGTIYTVKIDPLIQILKSVIGQTEKHKVFVRNASEVRTLPELKEAFCKTVAIPKSLRKAQYSRIQQKPKHLSWPDFATRQNGGLKYD